MKYRNSILRSIIGTSWQVETKSNKISYKSGDQSGVIDYYDVRQVMHKSGIISDTIIITSEYGRLDITDFSEVDAKKLCLDIEEQSKKLIASALSEHLNVLKKVSRQVRSFLSEDRYIARSNVKGWLNSFPDIGLYLSHPYFDISYLPKKVGESLSLLNDIQSPGSETLKNRNDEFVQNAMARYKKLFNKLEKHPLTDEQKRAAVIDEDRNLLIAAAGSGKSSTIVAKVAYLIESGLANPDEILVLTYDKNSQTEIEQRLTKALSKLKGKDISIKAKTCHSYGLEIIAEATGRKSNIAKIAAARKTILTSMFSNLITDLGSKNKAFYSAWLQYLVIAKQPLLETKNIKTKPEYDAVLKQMGALWKGTAKKQSLTLTTINNMEVKSLEELRIFNWLVLNGVNFEYERAYEISTADASHGQYHPDFFYPDANLYHEHFALDNDGNAPDFMKNYLEGVYWKRQLHEDQGTELIETRSADFFNEKMFIELKLTLKEHGVKFKPLRKEELDKLVKKSFNASRDINIFATVLKHFKSNNFTIKELEEKFKASTDKYRSGIFLQLFKEIYKEYQNRLKSAGEIDFEDQINQASSHLEKKDVLHAWKYVLVDEFQDISQDRKRLILSILGQDEYMKLFVVGDDWQSIYRFSGADIDIMTRFGDHFGATAQNNLSNTFRSYQGLVNVATTFIQKNPDQLKKTVTAQTDISDNQVIIREYSDEVNHAEQLWQLLLLIQKKAVSKKTRFSIFILARYNHHLPKNYPEMSDSFHQLDIELKTVHASKGLEADYVILLNLNNEAYGFPSFIEDDPLIKIILPKAEDFPHAEERRLFYVALTRAKRAIFLMSKKGYESTFVKELVGIPGVSAPLGMQNVFSGSIFNDNEGRAPDQYSKCPKCKKGALNIKNDKAGLYEPFFGCSEYPRCKYIQKPVHCPKCQIGKVGRRVNKKTQQPFYACNKIECDYKLNVIIN